MQAAVRSYKTMGVTLVGASVIAVSPMAPPLPDIHLPALNVSSVAVKLSALSNPFEQWAQLVQATLSNVGQLGQTVNANPAPILGQVVTNQVASAQVLAQVAQLFGQGFVQQLAATPGELQAAFQQLASGDIPDGLNAALNAVTGPVLAPLINVFLFSPLGAELTNVLQQPFANLSAAVNVLTNTGNLLPIILAPFNIAQNLTDAVSVSAQAMVTAVNQGNMAAFASAIIGLAPALVGAIINGSPLVPASEGEGLLGPQGPLAGILTMAQLVAKAITPATTAASSFAVNELPATSAKLVTLNAASPTKAVGALALTKIAAIAAPAAAAKTVTVDPASPAKDVNAVGTTATSGAVMSEASAATGTTKPSRLNPTKNVSDGIRKASKHAGDGSTNVAAGTGAKSSSTSTSNSKSSAGGSNGGGKHRASK
ncbi:MAG: hypothetical protein JWR11_1283 [Mycobacterium sp.]|jgi:hypothetical protein|nr:hypothetical protein [Mycobacterium sp.]MDT5064062.1 hypothetical protein [Mycobacterium sp.]